MAEPHQLVRMMTSRIEHKSSKKLITVVNMASGGLRETDLPVVTKVSDGQKLRLTT